MHKYIFELDEKYCLPDTQDIVIKSVGSLICQKHSKKLTVKYLGGNKFQIEGCCLFAKQVSDATPNNIDAYIRDYYATAGHEELLRKWLS